MRTLLLIDSGADISFLPAAVADILGIELSEEKHRSRGGLRLVRDADRDATSPPVHRRDDRTEGRPVLVPVEDPKDAGDTVMDYCLLGRSPSSTSTT